MNKEEMINNLETAINMIKSHYIADNTQRKILDKLEALYKEIASVEKTNRER